MCREQAQGSVQLLAEYPGGFADQLPGNTALAVLRCLLRPQTNSFPRVAALLSSCSTNAVIAGICFEPHKPELQSEFYLLQLYLAGNF